MTGQPDRYLKRSKNYNNFSFGLKDIKNGCVTMFFFIRDISTDYCDGCYQSLITSFAIVSRNITNKEKHCYAAVFYVI